MPLSFPSNPSVNQTSTQNGRVYRWSGSAWEFATVGASGNLTGTVTIPASGDPFWSNTLLLLRGNGNIVDESSYSRSVTAAGNVSATSPPKFGTNSIVFDGSNDWVTFAQNDFDFIPQLLASWTFEAWLYPTSYANYSMIMQHGANGPQCATAQILLNQGTGTVTAGVSSAGSDQKFMYVYTNDGLPLNAWTHLAAVYDATGEVLRLFLNGQLAGSEAKPSGGTWSYRNEGIRIGNYVDVNAASYGFVGRMDDVRISNAARYTASFTPPAATLPTGAYVAPITLPVSFTGGTSPVLADPSALKWITAPASATATGTAGQVAYDSSYLYVCTAANTWVRYASAGWLDSDAVAFLNAAGITDSTQSAAVSTLVGAMKTAGVWSKMLVVYPFVGGTAATHKWNLKDPRDLDAAYRLVFANGWTHASTGIAGDGTGGYADTKLNPATALSATSYAEMTYYRTNPSQSQTYPSQGARIDSTNPVQSFQTHFGSGDGNTYVDYGKRLVVSNSTYGAATGAYSISRTSDSLITVFRNGVSKATGTDTNNQVPSLNVYLGALNYNTSGATNWHSREMSFYCVSNGLTDAEMAALYSAVQAYQTTLGRQV